MVRHAPLIEGESLKKSYFSHVIHLTVQGGIEFDNSLSPPPQKKKIDSILPGCKIYFLPELKVLFFCLGFEIVKENEEIMLGESP